MINYSFSTVLMTVITSTVLIGIIALCFCSKKVICSIGDKLIAVLFLFTVARLLFPFELPFSENIIFPEPLAFIVCLIRHSFIDLKNLPVSFWTLAALVWVGGMVHFLISELVNYFNYSHQFIRYSVELTDAEPYYSALRKYNDDGPKVRIFSVPGLDAPCQHGIFDCKILIPDCLSIPGEAVPYIICHEALHFRHHDYLIKLGMRIISCIYWWNPLCKCLEKKLDLALELRVDRKLTRQDPVLKVQYFAALGCLKEHLGTKKKKRKVPSYMLAPRAFLTEDDLSKRALVNMYRQNPSLPLCVLLACTAAFICLCSYRFTFEPHYVLPSYRLDSSEVTFNLRAVPQQDGTYDIYLGDTFCEQVDSLEYYSDIPVEHK